MLLTPELIGLLVGALVIFIGVAIMSLKKGESVKISNRLQIDPEKDAINQVMQEIRLQDSIANKEDNLTWLQKKERELAQSNTGITFPVYLTILSISMLVICISVGKVLGSVVFGIPFSFIGVLVPEKIIQSAKEKNIGHFNTQLVKALRRMASVMRAGGSLKQALVDVVKSRSMPMVVRNEFKVVLTDIEYGFSIEEALYKLYERTGSDDVQFLAIAVEIQRQLGGNMAQVFDTISQTISNRNLMESEVRATLSQVKATSNILSAMPFLVGAALMFINPGYFDPLFRTIMGKMMFLGALSFTVIGIVVIKKLSNIKL